MPHGFAQPPRKGRYLFQVKHHRTSDRPSSEARQAVITDFRRELESNVLKRDGEERVNYFILVTNVPSSKDAIAKIDRMRSDLLRDIHNLHADVWWRERVVTYLDQMPSVWGSFPEMFAGGIAPFLAQVVDQKAKGLPRAIRIAINHQYDLDKNVKFRQIELEKNLAELFVDLDIDTRDMPEETQQKLMTAQFRRYEQLDHEETDRSVTNLERRVRYRSLVSALGVLLNDYEDTAIRKLILEGGPGQGKSTITQMAVQIYRQHILVKDDISSENRWLPPKKSRLPFRVELRRLAEWLSSNQDGSIES